MVNLSTAGINYFNTYDGVVSRDISVDGNIDVIGSLSGGSFSSGSTELKSSYFDLYDYLGWNYF